MSERAGHKGSPPFRPLGRATIASGEDRFVATARLLVSSGDLSHRIALALLASASFIVASASAANAADIPVKALARVAPVPSYGWSGFYIGGNVGYGVARNPSGLTRITLDGVIHETFNLSPHGVLGGGQAGYNWQSSDWVFGIETDIQASAQTDATTCITSCFGIIGTISQKLPLVRHATRAAWLDQRSGAVLPHRRLGVRARQNQREREPRRRLQLAQLQPQQIGLDHRRRHRSASHWQLGPRR